MITRVDTLEPLRDWFRNWNTCVVALDFESARQLFSPDVSGFGTFADVVYGLDRLEAEQWRNVWPRIAGFRFEVERLHGAIQAAHAWAACPWSSTGFHADGTAFERPGPTTVILRRDGDVWRGVHTHFSLNPGVPPRTHGRRA